jgi:hypothetical protein
MKKIQLLILVATLVAMVTLFLSNKAMSAGDCSGGANTCWDFSGSGLKVEIGPLHGTISNGWMLSQYNVTKKKNSNANAVFFVVEAGVTLGPQGDDPEDSNYTRIFPPGTTDPTTNLGGSRFFQVVEFSPNFPTGLSEVRMWTRPVIADPDKRYTLGQAAVKSGNSAEVELGTILLPAASTAELIEDTMIELTSYDGSRLSLRTDTQGNCLEAWVLPAGGDPGTGPGSGDWETTSCTGIDLEATSFCIPPDDDHPANSTVNGDPMHCGPNLHISVDSTILFEFQQSCVVKKGKLLCWP